MQEANAEFRNAPAFRLHDMIEQNRAVRRAYFSAHKGKTPSCEFCHKSASLLDEKQQQDLFELHYDVPMPAVPDASRSTVSDVILLCPKCHTALHDLMDKERRFISALDAKKRLGKVKRRRVVRLPETVMKKGSRTRRGLASQTHVPSFKSQRRASKGPTADK